MTLSKNVVKLLMSFAEVFGRYVTSACAVRNWPMKAPIYSLLVRAPDSCLKGCEFESQQEQWENVLLQSQFCVRTLICCLFHTPLLLQWHVKDSGLSAKKCRWQVTPKRAYTLDPTKSEWADYATIQALYGNLSGNELTCNLSGNTQSQLS